MNWWGSAILVGVLLFIASRGGLPVILTIAKALMPFVLFILAVKYITNLIFPDTRRKDSFPTPDEDSQDPNVIRICGACGREQGSCLKCKIGFSPRGK